MKLKNKLIISFLMIKLWFIGDITGLMVVLFNFFPSFLTRKSFNFDACNFTCLAGFNGDTLPEV